MKISAVKFRKNGFMNQGFAFGGEDGAVDENWALKADIKWNFTKFLINKLGDVVARFEPTIDMKEVETEIVKLL